MKPCILILSLLFTFMLIVAAQTPVKISIRSIGDRAAMQRKIESAIDTHLENLSTIRASVKEAEAASLGDQKLVLASSLIALDSIVERQDVTEVGRLLSLAELLHDNKTQESARILGSLGDSAALGTLNYFIDMVFSARLNGESSSTSNSDLDLMIRFYAGNDAQTSELSWLAPNRMIFLAGDRVIERLSQHEPDRIAAFYKAVLDARADARSGPEPDEEPIADAERPTAEQLRAYEASFGKLEELATKGALPKSDPKSQTTPTQASVIPPTVPAVPTAPKKAPSTALALSTPSEEPTSSTPRSIIVVLIVAATGLLWLLVKKRK